tara:strand:- start:23735 stop:24067 length:333 start_codon:yes stop_codon:yes gene_type:complete
MEEKTYQSEGPTARSFEFNQKLHKTLCTYFDSNSIIAIQTTGDFDSLEISIYENTHGSIIMKYQRYFSPACPPAGEAAHYLNKATAYYMNMEQKNLAKYDQILKQIQLNY